MEAAAAAKAVVAARPTPAVWLITPAMKASELLNPLATGVGMGLMSGMPLLGV